MPRLTTAGFGAVLAIAFATVACRPTVSAPPAGGPTPRPKPVLMQPLAALGDHHLVPQPVSVTPASGAPFALTPMTSVIVPSSGGEAARVGEALAILLRPATGFRFPVSAT